MPMTPRAARRRGALLSLVPVAFCAATLLGLSSRSAQAQDSYPSRPVRIVVPFAPGGAGDAVTRIVAQRLTARFGQQFTVDNRPGAGGTTGAVHCARSAPDGHRLCFSHASYSLTAAMQPGFPLDMRRDFVPVGFIGNQRYVLVARADASFKTAQELAAHARAHPGEVKMAHAGAGTMNHLLGVWFATEAKAQFNTIPYNGSAPAVNSLLAGQTDIYFAPPSDTVPHVQSGRLRMLAILGPQRMEVLPDVPTMKEAGYPVAGGTWFGLTAPAGTPRPIVERLNRELNAVLREDEVKQRLHAMYFSVEPTTPEGFWDYFAAQGAIWTKLIADNRLKAD